MGIIRYAIAGSSIFVMLAAVAAIIIFQFAEPDNPLAWFVVLGLPGLLTYSGIRQHYSSEREGMNAIELRAKARELEVEGLYFYIEKHLTSLTRNLERAMRTDEYGGLVRDDRIKEIDRFLKSVNFEPHNLRQSGELYDLFVQIVALLIGTTASTGFDPNSYPEDGLQFEFWVAESLRHFGWEASPTIGSGDQGVDVTAQKGSVTLAIQCKRYAGSVGNKAVQEIIAGRAYYGLAYGVVISTGSYTKSARDLARSCGISLLTPYDIPNIEQILKS
ncbi:MAG: restriction endonuclease [Erythrobacter sp.]|uniref:restriction endonuclease n=1 Tax=Erythrobacter sp. TaxID=1042 RepID=UPI001B1DD3EF|nr:restriction endonuclease [Erythrobacter sp.]MBO6767944.1 restriction endonuclease [Erythrobacter sp.]